ncbi:MAG TPA: hypothetical protein VN622_09560 [Clostridia bacterium]|nr:hypothetical protein [Clostridia bacterium]
MAQIQRTQDAEIDAQRTGSLLLTLGWLVLAVDALLGIYAFPAIRDGSQSWLWLVAILGVIGFTLLVAGSVKRSRGR